MDDETKLAMKVTPVRDELDSYFKSDSCLKTNTEIARLEDELFSWLEENPENAKIYVDDPIGTLKKFSSASDEVINKLKELSSSMAEEGGYVPASGEVQYLSRSDQSFSNYAASNQSSFSDWSTSLPHTGSNTISVLSYGDYVYAAGNGYLYKLNAVTGKIEENNDLKGRGKHEVRMTISPDGKDLYLGTDGYALGIKTSDLSTNWQKSLKNTRSDVISVLLDGDVLYAGGRGHVYKLRCDTGEQLENNDLPSRGNHEVRFALSENKERLYVGTDGYVISMTASDLETKWQTSLKDTRSDPVSLVVMGEAIYAGSRGRIFLLDSEGNIGSKNELPGRGDHDVRLTTGKVNGKHALFVGTDGYALALNSSDLKTIWQTSLPSTKDNVVNLLFDNNTLYAGSYGYVYQIAPDKGVIRYCDSLKDRGHHEVRLALSHNKSKLYIGTDGYALGRLSAGDPAAGWDIVSAIQTQEANKWLSSIHAELKVQKQATDGVDIKNSSKLQPVLSFGAPEIIDGMDGVVNARVSVKGSLSKGPLSITVFNGYIEVVVNLNVLKGQLKPKADSRVLSIDLGEAPLIESVSLAKLDYEISSESDVSGDNGHDLLLEELNGALSSYFPMELDMSLPIPTKGGEKVRVTYIAGDDAGFIGIMIGRELGNFHLDPDMIHNPKDSDGAIVISNRMIMNAIDEVMNAGSTVSSFSLTNEYPAVLHNDQQIDLPSMYSFGFHINKGDIKIHFDDQSLKTEIRLKYWGPATFWIHKSAYMYLDVDTSITEDGKVYVKFTGSTKIPWTAFISPVPIVGLILGILLESFSPLIQEKLDDILKNGLKISIPYFNANYIDTPAYIQLGGNWKDN